MKFFAKLGLFSALALAAISSFASDLAILTNGYTIRHERREVLGPNTRLFLGSDPSSYVDIPTNEIQSVEKDTTPPPAPAAAPKIAPVKSVPNSITTKPQLAPLSKPADIAALVNIAGDRHHIDPDFINSVIHAESGFNSRAVSPKGAQGLMQLMPTTASTLGVTDSFDAGSNVEGGTRYLRELLERYNYDVVKALAAYNAGPMRVDHYHGVPPYYETQAYIARIIKDFNRRKLAERKAAAAQAKLAAAQTKAQAKPRTVATKSSLPEKGEQPAPALTR